MPRAVKPALTDILEAIEGIENVTRAKSFEDFQKDWLLRHAVQRAIEIISEAARALPDEVLKQYPHIPWPQIKGMGNILRHEYHKVSDHLVWVAVTDKLPTLRACVRAIDDGL
jgi:uncharacterized protein with HEPN domain